MKTAIEISSLIMGQFVDSQEAIELIQEYGRNVAQQALKDASENAILFRGIHESEVDKDSILNTEIKTP